MPLIKRWNFCTYTLSVFSIIVRILSLAERLGGSLEQSRSAFQSSNPIGQFIGASLSEPHTSESNGGFFIYIYIIYLSCVFRKCKLNSFNPKHCARRSRAGGISKRTRGPQRIRRFYGTRV